MAAARRGAALLAAAFCAALTIAALPAQGVPVWEPGDPLPDLGPDLAPVRAAREAPTDAIMTPMPAPVRPAATTAPTKAAAAPEDASDFLCANAPEGTTAAVPSPFDRWLVRVCAPQGQALVPVEGQAWVAFGSADPVSILALVPGATPPGGAEADPRYDIRFNEFAGVEATGARRARATALLVAATPNGAGPPPHDAVWQLDAQSNIALPGETEGARYNLFFYVANGRPTRMIACLDACRQALHLEVLSGVEAAEVLGRKAGNIN
ncbi:MAG: hypothetical protein Q7V31_08445 [Parvibaculum sp.]|uniref:hypothetical protein n=1 Tax=Parvibaculum sp. TaxID=2024848 RepID=UPI0027198856|nr:hypothetical protein [Parvibaculum sp.]MDO8838947.1 hypothetical protein [Parvibaculum sp.]